MDHVVTTACLSCCHCFQMHQLSMLRMLDEAYRQPQFESAQRMAWCRWRMRGLHGTQARPVVDGESEARSSKTCSLLTVGALSCGDGLLLCCSFVQLPKDLCGYSTSV